MRRIVAAIVEREGQFLICQRSRDRVQPLKWEFPGGKVEDGESEAGALERELREELAIKAAIGPLLQRVHYRYPEVGELELAFYRVREFEGEPRNCVFEQIVWVAPEELAGYDFLEADREFVKRLAAGGRAQRSIPTERSHG